MDKMKEIEEIKAWHTDKMNNDDDCDFNSPEWFATAIHEHYEKRLEPLRDSLDAIVDGRAFDKRTGKMWKHWLEHIKQVIQGDDEDLSRGSDKFIPDQGGEDAG